MNVLKRRRRRAVDPNEDLVLRKSEEKYRNLVENSPPGLAIVQDSRFVFCNRAFSSMSGYSVEELLALHPGGIYRMIRAEDRDPVQSLIRNRLENKDLPQRYECRFITKDGNEIWLEWYAVAAEFEGKPAVQVALTDITERKNTETALRNAEERFKLIAETIDEIFWIFDLEKGAMIYVSPAHERICGYAPEFFLDDRMLPAVDTEDRQKVAAFRELIKTGQTIEFEYRILRPDGTLRHICNRGFPIRDATGLARRYVGVAGDITSRRKPETALEESREYLNRILDCIKDPVYVKDRRHRYVLVNEAACAFSGVRREELLGLTGCECLPEEQAGCLWEEEEVVFRTGQECHAEENLTDECGETRTMITRKSLLKGKDGQDQIVGIVRDITDHKRLEAQFLQSQKMEAIGLLAGGVAHDFNNLLSVIEGYSGLLLPGFAPGDPRHADLEQIRRASRQAAALTSQLLAFSRKQILKPEVLNLNTVVSEMSSMLRRLIGEDIELVAVADPALGLIHADPGQIQQIIMNIAVNSRDAMPEGGRLTIETANADLDADHVRKHPVMKEGPYVLLEIGDNGIGMDAETQARIFEPFFTTKEKSKRTGLGLSIVYGIVKRSHGFIWVYSELGKGTRFKIYFPRVPPPATRRPLDPSDLEVASGGFETVLIAEDEEMVRQLASRVLREAGYSVLSARDGREALEIAQGYNGKIDLVLTDVVMPGMSGRTLVSRLETMRPGIRALYVSGYADEAVVDSGNLASSVNFLGKPFTIGTLIRKVREAVQP